MNELGEFILQLSYIENWICFHFEQRSFVNVYRMRV